MSLKAKRILVTAGPTYESIDPVRFIGNRSTGKMGYAIARALMKKGAYVVLVLGPSSLEISESGIEVHRVESAEEMYQAVHKVFPTCDAAILSAAVADYTPKTLAANKIKKKDKDAPLILELVRTKDILASLGEIKEDKILVGFALETENGLENAKGKLVKKNLDFIVLNSLQDKGAGFKHNTNKITIIDRDNKITNFELKPKSEVAVDIVNYLINWMNKVA